MFIINFIINFILYFEGRACDVFSVGGMEVWESAIFKHRCPSHRNTWISILSIILSLYCNSISFVSQWNVQITPFLLVCNECPIFFLRWSTQPWRMFRWAWNVVPSKYLENWICLPILRTGCLGSRDHGSKRSKLDNFLGEVFISKFPKLMSLGWFGLQFWDSYFKHESYCWGGWIILIHSHMVVIFQFLGGGPAWVRAETVGKPGEMMQSTFVDFDKLDFVEWKHCRASKMVRYFGLVFAINWGTFDIVWGAKSGILYIRTYMYNT